MSGIGKRNRVRPGAAGMFRGSRESALGEAVASFLRRLGRSYEEHVLMQEARGEEPMSEADWKAYSSLLDVREGE